MYTHAKKLLDLDIMLLSVDQKTGIQALERLFPDKPVTFGHVKKREYEYKRHGTKNLIAGFAVATGEVVGRCYNRNRNNEFRDFLENAYRQYKDFRKLLIIADNYRTHTHINTCLLVARLCDIEIDERGLKTLKQRIDFMKRTDKRIVFHFLPKHASWLNQIEIWFGILEKKVIRRGNFPSTNNMENKIMNFMNLEWNPNAHPFKWTYQGKVCHA